MKPLCWAYLIAVCMFPRAVGVAINREANDDHVRVVELWIQQGEYPDESACWECFQPPLYSALQYANARVWDLTSRDSLIVSAQVINACLSVFILFLLTCQIQRIGLPIRWKAMLFLFIGLNPKLIAINIQATNDTLLIAIGMALLIVIERLIRRFEHRTSFWTLLYAQAYHSQFERYPYSWRPGRSSGNGSSRSDLTLCVDWIARCLFILGLGPAVCLGLGLCIQFQRGTAYLRRIEWQSCAEVWFYPVVAVVFLALLAKYSLDYRDYATIKLIFLFPMMPALTDFLAIGIETFLGSWADHWLMVIVSAMCIGFVANVGCLLVTLM